MQYATEILIIKAMKKKHEGNYFPVLDQNQVLTWFYMAFGFPSPLFLALCSSSDVAVYLTSLPLSLLVSLHVYTRYRHSFSSLIDKQLSRKATLMF